MSEGEYERMMNKRLVFPGAQLATLGKLIETALGRLYSIRLR